MTPEGRAGPQPAGAIARPALVVLAVALSAGFALLAHAAVVDGVPRAWGALLCLVPIALVLLVLLRRGRRAPIAVALLALAGAALWLGWGELERHFPDVLFLEHAALNVTLGVVFGRTLLPGREPLVTAFARVTHGGVLPAGVGEYTRKVTLAWTVFFAASLALSAALYASGLSAAWSLYANIVSPMLLVAMFAGEYALRYRVLPHIERIGPLGGMRAFVRHFDAQRAEASR